MDIHLPLACKPKTTIDFYKVLLASVMSDQYMVSGLTNCLVYVKHCNKTLKCFKTFNNVIPRLVYKGIYGLQCSQSVIPACFEMNESSASWKTNTQGKATSLMVFSIFVHDPVLMTLDLYDTIARASNVWTVSELPHNQSDNISSLQLESQKISFEGKKKSICGKCILNAKAGTNSPMATIYRRRLWFFRSHSFTV